MCDPWVRCACVSAYAYVDAYVCKSFVSPVVRVCVKFLLLPPNVLLLCFNIACVHSTTCMHVFGEWGSSCLFFFGMRVCACLCVFYTVFPYKYIICDVCLPIHPSFTIATSYCVCALENMYACFWWVVQLVYVRFCHARVSPFGFYSTIFPFTLISACFLSLHLLFLLLRPPIACVH